jgi:hypothetical protein
LEGPALVDGEEEDHVFALGEGGGKDLTILNLGGPDILWIS